jgi:DNA repair protein RadC
MEKIKDLELHQRPREKLQNLGPRSLSDQELIAILLGSGNSKVGVLTLAQRVVCKIDKLNHNLTYKDLLDIDGLGPAKASLIIAASEVFRRRIATEGTKIRNPEDIIPVIKHLADRKQETFICVSLSGAHEVIASRIVTVGLANLCQVHPREVFADPITDRACAVIVAHNHPSGDLTPSKEDLNVTNRLKESANILGIKFLDHIIFSKRGFYSIECGEKLGNKISID